VSKLLFKAEENIENDLCRIRSKWDADEALPIGSFLALSKVLKDERIAL
jgi:hypothetical protein